MGMDLFRKQPVWARKQSIWVSWFRDLLASTSRHHRSFSFLFLLSFSFFSFLFFFPIQFFNFLLCSFNYEKTLFLRKQNETNVKNKTKKTWRAVEFIQSIMKRWEFDHTNAGQRKGIYCHESCGVLRSR